MWDLFGFTIGKKNEMALGKQLQIALIPSSSTSSRSANTIMLSLYGEIERHFQKKTGDNLRSRLLK